MSGRFHDVESAMGEGGEPIMPPSRKRSCDACERKLDSIFLAVEGDMALRSTKYRGGRDADRGEGVVFNAAIIRDAVEMASLGGTIERM